MEVKFFLILIFTIGTLPTIECSPTAVDIDMTEDSPDPGAAATLRRDARGLEYPSTPEYAAPPLEYSATFDTKALQKWMNFAFIYSFAKYTAPSEEESEVAAAIYTQVADPEYEDASIASTLAQNITLLQMKALVNKTLQGRLISKGEHTAQINLLKSAADDSYPKFLNVIREHIILSGNFSGEIIYGITGFVQLSKKGGNVRGTLVNSFRRFKLNVPLTRGALRYSRGKECILWDTFCKANIHRLGNLEKSVISGILTYMRGETLTQFWERFDPLLAQLVWAAYKVVDQLPGPAKDYVSSFLTAGPDRRPDLVHEEFMLHGHLYDL